MTRFSKILAVAFVFAALALWSTPAQAQCGVPAGFGNLFGTVADCDDTGPVTGTLQGINANGAIARPIDDSFICLSETQPGCGGTRAGTVGDGLIAFAGDWANPNISGCPYEPLGETLGRNFYNITDASGNHLLFSVGRDRGTDAFAADNAWPSDAAGNITGNLACSSPRAGTTLISNTTSEIPGVGVLAVLELLCNAPEASSDCDATSRGQQLSTGSCGPNDPSFLGSVQALNLYSVTSNCSGADLNYDIARGGWVKTPGATDLGGGLWNASIFLPTTGCVFVGCSFGSESASTSGTCSSDGATCQVDGDCAGSCSNKAAACTVDSPDCDGFCSIAPLPCASDAACAAFSLGTCTSPAPGTCNPSTCVLDPPTQTEFAQVSSALAVTADNAPSPVALAVAAGFDKGKAFVSWRTETEVGVSAYQIERVGKDGRPEVIRQVSPSGQASSYREVFNPGELHKGGAKSVQIRTLLNGGGEILSDPASF